MTNYVSQIEGYQIKDTNAARSTHSHGNITSVGTVTAAPDTSIVGTFNGCSITVTDINNKIAKTSLMFDNARSGYFLSRGGTWSTPTGDHKVKQSQSTLSSYYPLLVADSVSPVNEGGTYFSPAVKMNPLTWEIVCGQESSTNDYYINSFGCDYISVGFYDHQDNSLTEETYISSDGIYTPSINIHDSGGTIWYIDASVDSSDYLPTTVSSDAYDNAISAMSSGCSVVLRWLTVAYGYVYGYLVFEEGTFMSFSALLPQRSFKKYELYFFIVTQNSSNIVVERRENIPRLNHSTVNNLSGTNYVSMSPYLSDSNTEYYTFVYSSGTIGTISITNITLENLGIMKYFKIINTSNVSKIVSVTSSGTLKGGGNITIPAQSLVEFSCTVTYGTSTSEIWGILTHSDSIPL